MYNFRKCCLYFLAGYNPCKPVVSRVGDIRDEKQVQEAMKGVDTVFHTAALVSFGTHPDFNGMEQVNVTGE